MSREFSGKQLDLVSFPMGGLGAGSICLQGTGGLGSFSLWNKPAVKEQAGCEGTGDGVQRGHHLR